MIELKPAINEVKLTLKSISRSVNMGTVVEPSGGSGVPTNVREAIYTLLENAAYVTTGLEDEIAIVQNWAQEVTALSLDKTSLTLNNDTPQTITATVVPSGSTITWTSSDNSVATVVGGVVTGVANGSCVITATAGGKSANCAVTVSGFATLESISALYTQSGVVLVTTPLDDLKQDLVVTGTYSDTTTAVIPSDGYTLSGTLTAGTSTITVTCQGKTTTFNVTVTSHLYELASTFTSTGTESINTNVKAPANGVLTIAIEYSTTAFDSTIRYVFSTKKSTNSNYAYYALQNQLSVGKNYTWGSGISWNTGNNLVATNNVVRMVILCTFSNSGLNISIENHYKNVTKNTSNTYTNTYTASTGTYDEGDIYLGQAISSSFPGFKGYIDRFIIDNYTWDSTAIDDFLAGN